MFTWADGDLNSEQEAALLEEGSIFLMACPGSGKTRTLTYKIAYELSRLESRRQFVVAITYTHRAADEIQERIEDLGLDTSQLWIGTIHSFCLEWILKPYGIYHDALKQGFRVIDAHERQLIFEELCVPYKHKRITFWDCEFYFEEERYVHCCPNSWKHADLDDIFARYFQILQENRWIDFELILFYAYELVIAQPQISKVLALLFPFILIDEYQDTKRIQYLIVAAILKAGQGKTNTFIVGDPNQAIYETMGGFPMAHAEFQSMAGLPLKELYLSRNYRSSKRVIRFFQNFNLYQTQIDPASKECDYPSLISFNDAIDKGELVNELIRLLKFNIDAGIEPHEICILAPQWVYLASMTRQLVSSMPEYQFNGPGTVPFARDMDNFWYKLSKIALTTASPEMYTRRLRWAGEVLMDMRNVGIDTSELTRKLFLRECNAIKIEETDGLCYLSLFFDAIFSRLGIDLHVYESLLSHYEAFFDSSKVKIALLTKEGGNFISDISTFRKVFQSKSGITISTIHGIKGTEFDTVIAYALLEEKVPHFNDPKGQETAMKMLYVIGSRARKNLHLISERGRSKKIGGEYQPTIKLADCSFPYDAVSSG